MKKSIHSFIHSKILEYEQKLESLQAENAIISAENVEHLIDIESAATAKQQYENDLSDYHSVVQSQGRALRLLENENSELQNKLSTINSAANTDLATDDTTLHEPVPADEEHCDLDSETVDQPDVVLLHDSICKRINNTILSREGVSVQMIPTFTLTQVVDELEHLTAPRKAIVVHVGVNDLKTDDAPTVAERTIYVTNLLRTKFPHLPIILSNIVECDDKHAQDAINLINGTVNLKYDSDPNIHTSRHHIQKWGRSNGDGIHLNDEGTRTLAGDLKNTITQVLGITVQPRTRRQRPWRGRHG